MTEQNATAMFSLQRVAALALYAGQEGQINLHKLLEAAIYAATRSATTSDRKGMTFAALSPVLADLRTLGIAPALIDVLEHAQATITAGGVPLIEEAPDVFVCRVCGHTALASAPSRCPTCNAWPATFRHFAGIFNVDNPDPLASLALLAQGPDVVAGLIGGLPEATLIAVPAPDAWSLKRALQHLVDAQSVLVGRIDRMLAEEDPPLVMESVWERAAAAQDTHSMLDDFRRTRSATVALLEALPMKAWGRTGRHTEFGRVTLLQQVGYFAYHEAFHFPDFVEKRRQLGVMD